MSPNTERRFRQKLEAAGMLEGPEDDLPELSQLKAVVGARKPPQEVSSVEDWRQVIEEKLSNGAGPRAIYDWLRVNDPDFDGSYWAVKRLCRQIRKKRPSRPGDVVIPVETGPGQVAQVDFGYVGMLLDPETGRLRKAWVFVMVLAFCRHLFAKVVFDQKTITWLALHVEAFAFFGGVPEVVVPDNTKVAVIRAAFGLGDSPALNRSYCELARHYGFRIDPTPPYSPEKKGKVESSVKYVKRSYFAAWTPTTLPEANEGLKRWNLEVASVRVHGATQRVPIELFESEELPALRPLPGLPFELVEWKQAKVHRDAHIQARQPVRPVCQPVHAVPGGGDAPGPVQTLEPVPHPHHIAHHHPVHPGQLLELPVATRVLEHPTLDRADPKCLCEPERIPGVVLLASRAPWPCNHQLVHVRLQDLHQPARLRPLLEAQVTLPWERSNRLHQRLSVGLHHHRAESSPTGPYYCQRAACGVHVQPEIPVHRRPPGLLVVDGKPTVFADPKGATPSRLGQHATRSGWPCRTPPSHNAYPLQGAPSGTGGRLLASVWSTRGVLPRARALRVASYLNGGEYSKPPSV
jgi:transposase